MATPPDAGAAHGEGLEALEEQRDFLLRSLDDLEREWAAGDIDEQDYLALKDDYTARAAAALRAIDGGKVRAPAVAARTAQPRRRGAAAIWVVGIAVLGMLAGLLVAQASGRRNEGDTISGDIRETSRQLLADANQAFADGDIDAAIEAYDQVLADEPANVEALTYRGWLLYGEGEVDEGVAQMREAVAADQTFVDAWSFLLLALDKEGRTDEAMAGIEELAVAGDTDIAVAIAQQLGGADQVLLAIRVYDAVLEAEPDNVIALTYRGWLLHLAELDDEALTYLDRALAVDGDFPDALAFRAIVLKELGRIDDARAALAAFDAADPPEEMRSIIDASDLREDLAE